jgi:hypothetical protein
VQQYSIRFIGHVIETRKPLAWPDTIECGVIFETDDIEDVRAYLEKTADKIKREQGIYTQINLPGQEKSMDEFGNGKFVPLHMFTHVSFSVRRLSGVMPNENDKGVFRQ